MSNEQYLFVSYPLTGLISLLLGWATFRFLRNSLVGTVDHFTSGPLAQVIRRLFRPGLMMVALAGFLSVSYKGCGGPTTYAQIVAKRSHLVSKTYEQVAAIIDYLSDALVVWAFLLAIVLCLARIRGRASPER